MNELEKLRRKFGPAAFFTGNGPNLSAGIFPSWKDLLVAAAYNGRPFDPDGLTNTEVYDMVELNARRGTNVKRKVCEQLALNDTMNLDVHRRLMEFAIDTDSPVLTTNFDAAFEESVNAKLLHISSNGFTYYYPWKSYYGFTQHLLPTDGFGIWKIHGDIRYPASIRLGLTDYMGSAEKARALIHKGAGRLVTGKQQDSWNGMQTWLHIWFNMPIIVLGFGYNTDEVFLRWLLIERCRYYKSIKRPMDVWYITTDVLAPAVKNLLNNIGVKIKQVATYAEIYG